MHLQLTRGKEVTVVVREGKMWEPGKMSWPNIRRMMALRCFEQSYEIKSPPWTILWFRILGIFSVENIARLGVFMFQTSDNSQLCIDSQYSSQ